MFTIRRTEEFDQWLDKLDDAQAVFTIASRIERLRFGNFGDSKSVGDGITELRIHLGPGYRIYLTQRGRQFIIVLGGGTKRRQAQDIRTAKARAGRLTEGETS